MVDIVVSVAAKVAEYMVAPIGRQCGYVIFTDSYVSQLEKELEKLDDARVTVQHSVNDAQKNNMRKIKREVNRWQENAETVANKARGMLDTNKASYDGRAKKTCFYGWLPNPKERYRLGRYARKTIQAIASLILEGKFENVSYESDPPGQVGAPDVNSSISDGGDTITDSRAPIFQRIMEALDDEKLKVIGVYGPGGVGKTTLLGEVEKKLRKAGGPFHMILKAKVSQNYVLENIQDKIAYDLKLDLKDVQSTDVRADRLLQRLRSNPSEKVLIILDDLWQELDLTAVGIPSRDVSGKCKLLLTSRYRDVLELNMLADSTFLLEGLNYDDAFKLFEKTVGDRLKEDEELKAIAPQVVNKLAGLPLLINSVANTLKNRSLSAWEIALTEINVKKMETIVKLSYDHLENEEAQKLFLLCGLIGGTIEVETLLVLGMGLGLFAGLNQPMQYSRGKLNKALDSLRSICLLQDGGDDEENVIIHDLYSEVVVSTPFTGQNSLIMNSNCGSWPKEKREKCWAISLTDIGRGSLAELMACHFPDLKILMLSRMLGHQHDMKDCLGLLDFTCMKELRVLYLRSMHITSLPSLIGILGNLCSLYLDSCSVKDVAILGKLKALQILSFVGSTISRLPKEIGELTNLRLLNLSYCYGLNKIELGALEGLIKLEELYMKGSFDRWGEDEIPLYSGNARLAELKSLTKLTALEISIPNPTVLLKDGDLPFGNLIRFWINIGNVKGGEFNGLKTMKLKLEGCDSILSREWVQKIMEKTQHLHLDGLRDAHELCTTQRFGQLKHLDILDNPSIKYIVNSSKGIPLTTFTILESLFLKNLTNLEKICHGPVVPECLSKLKAVSVKKCDRLKNLWFLSEIQRLEQLKELEIRECDSMQAIVTDDAGKDIVATNNRVELPNVRRLKLVRLPNMTSFCIGAGIQSEDAPTQVSLPRLESLEMDGVLGLEKIRDSVVFRNLKELFVGNTGLTFLFPVSVAKCLREIRTIKVVRCPNMKALILDEEGRDEGTNDIMEFPLLERLSICECPMEKFFSCPNAKKESIATTSNSQDAYSNSFFDQKVTFPDITTLYIEGVRCKELWNNDIPVDSFCQLKSLELRHCDNLLSVAPSHMWKRLQYSLEILEVESCRSIEIIYDGDGTVTKNGKLVTMVLRDLANLRHIWQSDGLPNIPFPNLRCVKAARCSGLKMLFATFTEEFLGQIEELVVESCENMELIAGDEECEEAIGRTITFSKLTDLRLFELPKFRSFLPEKYSLKLPYSKSEDFPSLRVLSIVSCGTEEDRGDVDWEILQQQLNLEMKIRELIERMG